MKQKSFIINEELHKKVKIHCATIGCSLSDFIKEAIREKLEKDNGKK